MENSKNCQFNHTCVDLPKLRPEGFTLIYFENGQGFNKYCCIVGYGHSIISNVIDIPGLSSKHGCGLQGLANTTWTSF